MRPYHRLLFSFVLASGALLVGEAAALAQQPYYGPAPAYGPPPPAPAYAPQPRRYSSAPHYFAAHDGLFLRLAGGLGYLSASENVSGGSLNYSGVGFTLSGALGGAIAPNLILYGEILGTSVVNAEQSYAGVSQGLSGLDVVMYGFGPGIAYYIEPVNVYLSATLTFSKISFSDTYSDYYLTTDTNLGLGGSFSVGKEWWIAQRLGLGIAGQLHVASMTDPYYNAHMTATALSVLCSLTFN
jgi:hypothetical protein